MYYAIEVDRDTKMMIMKIIIKIFGGKKEAKRSSKSRKGKRERS